MKASKFLSVVIVVLGILLSACTPAANSSVPIHVGGGKVQPDVVFTGAIESMNGNQWVINGQTITVDQSVLQDGSFSVGDTVKVESSVVADGSVTAKRVETPSANNSVEISTSIPEDSTSAPDAVSTPVPNSTPQSPKFDDKGNEAAGTVDAITTTSITIAGQTYTFALGAEIKGNINAGATVELHFTTNADGTLSVTEVEIADSAKVEDNHSNSTNASGDHSNTSASPDNHGGVNTSSDDGSNHDANDNHGGGSNSGGGNNSGGNSSGG